MPNVSMNTIWRLREDAASTSNAIEIENFYQHAEHYLRQMREQTVQD